MVSSYDDFPWDARERIDSLEAEILKINMAVCLSRTTFSRETRCQIPWNDLYDLDVKGILSLEEVEAILKEYRTIIGSRMIEEIIEKNLK